MTVTNNELPCFTEGIEVELTPNGLWVEARHMDGPGWDRYFIPAHRLRRLAAGTWKEDV
jgi:hypothetical protein